MLRLSSASGLFFEHRSRTKIVIAEILSPKLEQFLIRTFTPSLRKNQAFLLWNNHLYTDRKRAGTMSQESIENTYFIDPKNPADVARLNQQGHLLDKYTDTVPQEFVPGDNTSILDLGCGPGAGSCKSLGSFHECISLALISTI